jgi:hypothetical protein
MTAEDLKKLLPDSWDNGMSTHILAACATTRLPLSYGLALVEKETGGQNIYGHDPVANPAPKGGRVTAANYKIYKANRKRGLGMQGVGPTQLTWYALQDSADAIGGCHKPYPNLVVGFSNLKRLINLHGKQAGAAAFNGTGDAARMYGKDFVHKQQAWHSRVS